MTVKELIEKLKSFPPDALVVTEGYEEGYDTIKKASTLKVEENPQKKWYVGEYTDSDKPNAIQVVYLYAAIKDNNK